MNTIIFLTSYFNRRFLLLTLLFYFVCTINSYAIVYNCMPKIGQYTTSGNSVIQAKVSVLWNGNSRDNPGQIQFWMKKVDNSYLNGGTAQIRFDSIYGKVWKEWEYGRQSATKSDIYQLPYDFKKEHRMFYITIKAHNHLYYSGKIEIAASLFNAFRKVGLRYPNNKKTDVPWQEQQNFSWITFYNNFGYPDNTCWPIYYRIVVATTPNFDSVYNDNVNGGYCTSSSNCKTDLVSSSSFRGFQLKENTWHYWRVRAGNECGGGHWSDTWSFKTKKKELPADLDIDPNYRNFTWNYSGYKKVMVRNKGEQTLEWKIQNRPSWVTIKPQYGSLGGKDYKNVEVYVSKNNSTSKRTYEIKFVNDNNSSDYEILTIEQDGKPLSAADIDIDPNYRNFTWNYSGYKNVKVINKGEQTLEWKIQNRPPWVTIEPQYGSLGGKDYKYVKVYVSKNNSSSKRTYEIKFVNDNNSSDYEILTIEQDGRPLSPADLDIDPNYRSFTWNYSGYKNVKVINKGEQTLEWKIKNRPSWVTIEPQYGSLGGSNNKTVNVSVSNNNSNSKRNCEIKFVNDNNSSDYEILTIEQDGRPLSPADLDIDPKYHSFTWDYSEPKKVKVMNKGEQTLMWKIPNIPSWVKVSDHNGSLSGNNNTTVMVSVSKNDSTNKRNCEIRFFNHNNSSDFEKLIIEQDGRTLSTADLEVNQNAFSFSWNDTNEESISILNKGEQPLSWKIDENPNWIALSSNSGTIPGLDQSEINISVTNNTSGENRNYNLKLYNEDNLTDYVNINISQTMNLEINEDGVLEIEIKELSFSWSQNEEQYIDLFNTGDKMLNWAVKDVPEWIKVSPLKGSISGDFHIKVGIAATQNTENRNRESQIKFYNTNSPSNYKIVLIKQAKNEETSNEISNNFRYPVGNELGEGWLINRGGLQWLDVYNYGGQCGNVFHPGIDFNKDNTSHDQDLGEPVYAIANGVVQESIFNNNGWGNIILIRHTLPDNSIILSQYAHLNDREVNIGESVSFGQKIGTVGKGINYDAHLHFEIRREIMKNDSASFFPCNKEKTWVESHYYDPEEFILNHQNQRVTQWNGNGSIISYHGRHLPVNINNPGVDWPYGITQDVVQLHKSKELPVGFFQWQINNDGCGNLKISLDTYAEQDKNIKVDINVGYWDTRNYDRTFNNVELPFIIGEDNTDFSMSDGSWYVVKVAFRQPLSRDARLDAICTDEVATNIQYKRDTDNSVKMGDGYEWNGNASIISHLFREYHNQSIDSIDWPYAAFRDVTIVHPSDAKPMVFFQWQKDEVCKNIEIDATELADSEKIVDIHIKDWCDENGIQLNNQKLPLTIDANDIDNGGWKVIQITFKKSVTNTSRVEAICK